MSQFSPQLTGKKNYTGTRFAQGSRSNRGRYMKGAGSPISFVGNDQPVSDKELLLLPEGDRVKRVRKLYTTFALQPESVENETSGDEVIVEGETFVVMITKIYEMGVLDHTKAILVRRDQ